jgi:hypothetical protein
MQFIREKNGLKIKLDRGEKTRIKELKQERGEIHSTFAMLDFFDHFLGNAEFNWIQPEQVCALTSAPMLGVYGYANDEDMEKGENEIITEAYAYMDYAVCSPLEELLKYGEIFFEGGETEPMNTDEEEGC